MITEFASEPKLAHEIVIPVLFELHLYVQRWHLNNRRIPLVWVRPWLVPLASMDMAPEDLQVFRCTLPTFQPGNQGRTATQGLAQQ